jgi:hypothetical protein
LYLTFAKTIMSEEFVFVYNVPSKGIILLGNTGNNNSINTHHTITPRPRKRRKKAVGVVFYLMLCSCCFPVLLLRIISVLLFY